MSKYTQIFNDVFDYNNSLNNKLHNGTIQPDEPFLGLVPPNHIIYSQAVNFDPNGHEFVDMGFPSGTLWATCALGADTPGALGDFYAWGEIYPKSNYTWETYAWGTENNLTKYNNIDGKRILDLDDDAANYSWGGTWHIPTPEQIDEFSQYTRYVYDDPLKLGYQSTINGNVVWFRNGGAESGEMDGTEISHLSKYRIEFLSNELVNNSYTHPQHFIDDGEGYGLFDDESAYTGYRYCGFQIRPVMDGHRRTFNEPEVPAVPR